LLTNSGVNLAFAIQRSIELSLHILVFLLLSKKLLSKALIFYWKLLNLKCCFFPNLLYVFENDLKLSIWDALLSSRVNLIVRCCEWTSRSSSSGRWGIRCFCWSYCWLFPIIRLSLAHYNLFYCILIRKRKSFQFIIFDSSLIII
jgi:hypothetical protein